MRVLALAALAFLLAGCFAPAADVQPASSAPAPSARHPSVVIAVVDTGINPYHAEYRRNASTAESNVALLASFGVANVTPVALHFDAADVKAAEKADHDALMKLAPKTLYTFPGTKILGAISFEEPSKDWPVIVDLPDTYAHGTMTTSRATGNTVSIPGDDPDVHLVIVQGFGAAGVRWAADQPWIDVISISAGISPYSIVPGAPNVLDTDGIPAYNHASHQKPFFASTGNGFVNAGVLGFPAALRGSSGVPDAVSVSANDNDQISHWHNQDGYVSADGCQNPRADPATLTKILLDGGGTSSATPFSAGGGAKLLLEARRILNDTHVGPVVDKNISAPTSGWSSGRAADAQVVLARGEPNLVPDGPLKDGVFTLLELKDVLYHTALVTPTNDKSDGVRCDAPSNLPGGGGTPAGGTYVPAALVPEQARFPFDGYGEVNHASIAAAVKVLKGEAKLPARPGDDAQYDRARQIKMDVVGDKE